MHLAELSYFMLIFGLGWTVAGAYMLWHTLKRERLGYFTKGEIVDVIREFGDPQSRHLYVYYPLIRITTADNVTIDRKMDVYTVPSLWVKGKRLSVVYFEDKIYPVGIGWKILFSALLVTGIGIVVYEVLVS